MEAATREGRAIFDMPFDTTTSSASFDMASQFPFDHNPFRLTDDLLSKPIDEFAIFATNPQNSTAFGLDDPSSTATAVFVPPPPPPMPQSVFEPGDYRGQMNAGLESPLDSPYTPPIETICPSDFNTSPAWGHEGLPTPQLAGFSSISLFGGNNNHSNSSTSSSLPSSPGSSPFTSPSYHHQPFASPTSSHNSPLLQVKQEEIETGFGLPPISTSTAVVHSSPLVESAALEEDSPEEPEAEVDDDDDQDDYKPTVRGSRKRKPSTGRRSSSVAPSAGNKRIFNGVRGPSAGPDRLALDAPIQKRQYFGNSSTSRKEIPKAMVKSLQRSLNKKRGGSSTPLDAEDVADEVAARRAQNTLAARQSRQRKADYVAGLEAENEQFSMKIEELEGENQRFRTMLLEQGVDASEL